MKAETQVVPAPQGGNPPPPQLERPGRALLGWMEPAQAELIQAFQRPDSRTREHIERALQARTTVGKRSPGINQEGLVTEAPDSLRNHINALRASSYAAAYFNEGWRVAVVDLRRVCALQPNVYTDHAAERTSGAQSDDLLSVATICLPASVQAPPSAQFDSSRQAWMLTAADPNLRIVGNMCGAIPPGGPVTSGLFVGFALAYLPSFVQVAHFRGRYLLRDGYHRAYGLIRAGIFRVPAFVRDFAPLDELVLPPGLLPQSRYLGERPPLLPDYLDDAVSADVTLPAFQKLVIVQGLELTPSGMNFGGQVGAPRVADSTTSHGHPGSANATRKGNGGSLGDSGMILNN